MARSVIVQSGQALGISHLKNKQTEAVETFASGHDTFVSLYGKSVIYAVLPLVFDKIRST